jgi:hypothetical protein
MADLSDVENALVTLCGAILYPNGSGNPSITGYPSREYRGWPTARQLDTDLVAGISHVSVCPAAGYSRIEPGYIDLTPLDVPGVPTLTATVSNETVTIGGMVGAGQLVGAQVNGASYVYALTGSDTLATAAAALVALVNAGPIEELIANPGTFAPGSTSTMGDGTTAYGWVGSTCSITELIVQGGVTVGVVITFNTTRPIYAQVGAQGTSQTRPRWQCQGVRITTWAPTPAIRDAICSTLDAALSNTYWLTLPDNQQARFEWRNSYVEDVQQRENLWKRDLIYTAQFATSITVVAAPVLFPQASINENQYNR